MLSRYQKKKKKQLVQLVKSFNPYLYKKSIDVLI